MCEPHSRTSAPRNTARAWQHSTCLRRAAITDKTSSVQAVCLAVCWSGSRRRRCLRVAPAAPLARRHRVSPPRTCRPCRCSSQTSRACASSSSRHHAEGSPRARAHHETPAAANQHSSTAAHQTHIPLQHQRTDRRCFTTTKPDLAGWTKSVAQCPTPPQQVSTAPQQQASTAITTVCSYSTSPRPAHTRAHACMQADARAPASQPAHLSPLCAVHGHGRVDQQVLQLHCLDKVGVPHQAAVSRLCV